MDLTLAYAVRAKVAQRGTQMDNWQFRTLALLPYRQGASVGQP